MATLIIRNLPDDAHQALKAMAANLAGRAGRANVEGLARSILVEAAHAQGPTWVDDLVAAADQIHAQLRAAGEPITADELDRIFARQQDKPDYPDFSGPGFGPNE